MLSAYRADESGMKEKKRLYHCPLDMGRGWRFEWQGERSH